LQSSIAKAINTIFISVVGHHIYSMLTNSISVHRNTILYPVLS